MCLIKICEKFCQNNFWKKNVFSTFLLVDNILLNIFHCHCNFHLNVAWEPRGGVESSRVFLLHATPNICGSCLHPVIVFGSLRRFLVCSSLFLAAPQKSWAKFFFTLVCGYGVLLQMQLTFERKICTKETLAASKVFFDFFFSHSF